MKAENFNVSVPEGKEKVEVVLREVNDEVKTELPVLEPAQVAITGNITAPFAFLEKRWNAGDEQIDHCRTHIIVRRDELKICLVVNETDKRNVKKVDGEIALSRQYIAFGINAGKAWQPEELGNFFRINRTYFDKPEDNMKLVSLLKSFRAKVSAEVEREVKNNGSLTDTYRQVVNSNLPQSFFINIPVFKGTERERIEIEIIAHVSGRDVELELISADAAAIEEEVRDRLINEQLEKICELAPEIPIIEA